jgi:hypothetical protein
MGVARACQKGGGRSRFKVLPRSGFVQPSFFLLSALDLAMLAFSRVLE